MHCKFYKPSTAQESEVDYKMFSLLSTSFYDPNLISDYRSAKSSSLNSTHSYMEDRSLPDVPGTYRVIIERDTSVDWRDYSSSVEPVHIETWGDSAPNGLYVGDSNCNLSKLDILRKIASRYTDDSDNVDTDSLDFSACMNAIDDAPVFITFLYEHTYSDTAVSENYKYSVDPIGVAYVPYESIDSSTSDNLDASEFSWNLIQDALYMMNLDRNELSVSARCYALKDGNKDSGTLIASYSHVPYTKVGDLVVACSTSSKKRPLTFTFGDLA